MSKFKEELSKYKTQSIKETIVSSLDEQSYKDFLEAIKDRTVAASTITIVLNNLGVEVSENTVRRWRRELERNV